MTPESADYKVGETLAIHKGHRLVTYWRDDRWWSALYWKGGFVRAHPDTGWSTVNIDGNFRGQPKLSDRDIAQLAQISPGPEHPPLLPEQAAMFDGLKFDDYDDPNLFKRWTTAELLASRSDFRWLIRGYRPQPTYGMTGGPEKTLKSYIQTIVNMGLAAGVPIFDHFDVPEPQTVVSYVGEGGRELYTRRLERIARAMNIDLDDIPLISMFDSAAVDSGRFQMTLQRDLEELEPALVTIDPWYMFHGAKTDARNLLEEGALLGAVSKPCMEAGASLDVVHHFNQSGSGTGLRRLTMSGGAEWCDSWTLITHREDPNVDGGIFKLRIDIGSRQWGGTSWDLDLTIGAFDEMLGIHVGDITWRLQRATASRQDDDKVKILEFVRAHPFECTQEEIAKGAGGNVKRMRDVIRQLEESGQIKRSMTARQAANGRNNKVWTFGPSFSDVQPWTPEDDTR